MTDDQELVKRLREVSGIALMREAVDAIERLTQAVAERDGQLEVAIGHIDHVTAERDAAYQAGALAMREACAKHHNEMVKFCLSEREQEERKDMRRYWADIKSAHHDSAIAVRAIDPASVKS